MKPLHVLGLFSSLTLFACTGSDFTSSASDEPAQGEMRAPTSVVPYVSPRTETTFVVAKAKDSCPTNACGGCGKLEGELGAPCDTSGIFECSADRSSLVCGEKPTFPTCATAGGEEIVDANRDDLGGAVPDYFDDVRTIAIGHTMRHDGSITKVKLAIVRQDWFGYGPEGTLRLELFKGVAGSPSVVQLATATHSPIVPEGEYAEVTFVFDSPTPLLAKDTAVHFRLSVDSHRFRYRVGGNVGGIPEFPFHVRKDPGALWEADLTNFQPRTEVDVLECR